MMVSVFALKNARDIELECVLKLYSLYILFA